MIGVGKVIEEIGLEKKDSKANYLLVSNFQVPLSTL